MSGFVEHAALVRVAQEQTAILAELRRLVAARSGPAVADEACAAVREAFHRALAAAGAYDGRGAR